MSAIHIITERGPRTFKAVKAVKGGQIVVAGTGGVEPATADAEKVIGVAITDGSPQVKAKENELVAQKPEHVAVAYSGMEVYLTTTSQLNFGDKVGADENGAAKAHSSGDVVGIVTDSAPSENRALVRLA
ncbi:structural cement protein Gp24 [Corynebacterium ulcerans]|uniref:structural cement protein Gp24 n=1 Tax=Corynebacterium ulcerans TaxID=65058 RepID=UPI0002141C19|nr:DUF2190 family protein [Corynebacterium ulcerans]AEG81694.1 hypothetical protein CULC809_01161 [Corynebacterium ulcerans 809]AEG83886.1 hypothetical protein CULC22_01176 [Corynebacterium ulcerans BR-AD22]